MIPDPQRLLQEYEQHLQQAPPPAALDVPEAFWYVHYKAFTYLRFGPDDYRVIDYFSRPPVEWPETALAAVKLGCEQILNWRGLTPDQPLDGIGIGGFYSLLRVFHFELAGRGVVSSSADTFLDEMRMKHGVDGREVTLYNRVQARSGEKPPGPPCPHCGEPLRTPMARQCRACGMDWHDPRNVVNRKTGAGGG